MTEFFLTRLLPVLLVLGAATFGVHKYNDGLREDGRIEGRASAKAQLDPVIKQLAVWVVDRDKILADYKAQSDALKTKIATNQGVLNATLKKLDQSSTELAMLRGSDAEFKRLLDSATANSGGATHASAIAGLERLTAAHHQCQARFRAERNRHAKTLDGLEQALAVIDALQLK